MELLRIMLRYTHLLGFAGVTFGIVSQWKHANKKITPTLLTSAVAQLLSGIALVGVLGSLDTDLNLSKISLKLGLAFVIVILATILRKKEISKLSYSLLLGLIISQSLIATFWN